MSLSNGCSGGSKSQIPHVFAKSVTVASSRDRGVVRWEIGFVWGYTRPEARIEPLNGGISHMYRADLLMSINYWVLWAADEYENDSIS